MLDELQNLSNIRHLWIERLEKAMPSTTMMLRDMVRLKELGLCCTMDANPHNRTHYEIVERVHEKLVPWFHRGNWNTFSFMVSLASGFPNGYRSEPQDKLPHLGHMHFNECIAFSELPPAGQLPEPRTVGPSLEPALSSRLGTGTYIFLNLF